MQVCSHPKAKRFAAIGYVESVKIALVQYDSFLIYPSFQFQKYKLCKFLEIFYC